MFPIYVNQFDHAYFSLWLASCLSYCSIRSFFWKPQRKCRHHSRMPVKVKADSRIWSIRGLLLNRLLGKICFRSNGNLDLPRTAKGAFANYEIMTGSIIEQECIPVGCVPSAAVDFWWGGGGVSAQGGVCLGGMCNSMPFGAHRAYCVVVSIKVKSSAV